MPGTSETPWAELGVVVENDDGPRIAPGATIMKLKGDQASASAGASSSSKGSGLSPRPIW